jgi:hypothetical protein
MRPELQTALESLSGPNEDNYLEVCAAAFLGIVESDGGSTPSVHALPKCVALLWTSDYPVGAELIQVLFRSDDTLAVLYHDANDVRMIRSRTYNTFAEFLAAYRDEEFLVF